MPAREKAAHSNEVTVSTGSCLTRMLARCMTASPPHHIPGAGLLYVNIAWGERLDLEFRGPVDSAMFQLGKQSTFACL